MTTRHLVAVIGLLWFAGCGQPDPSNECAATCTGCCQNGVCQSGNSVDACGQGGLSCDRCVGSQVCSTSGRCATSSPGGGAGGGGEPPGDGPGGGGTAGGGGSAGGSAGGTGGGQTCTPETDAALCTAASRKCGSITVTDRCGQRRTIAACGACATQTVCTTSGTCVCQQETNLAFCQRMGASCGTVSGNDNCGVARSVNCGTCTGSNTCGGGGLPNTCGCTSETDAQFCTRSGISCGSRSGIDNCGKSRTVASCGSCVSPTTCSAGSCFCPSESSSQFCTRMGAQCGAVSGTDTCGQPRNVANCGNCSTPKTCGGGGAANQCGCTSQSDAVLCAARAKDCGTLTLTDNCGATRTISCGTCAGTSTCGGGGVANVCGCTPESNGAFCSRVGATCGSLTAADNCGAARTVSSCGSCVSPKTCSSANQCACVPETDAQVCARIGKTCGALTATDNCGASRTIASCGSCAAGTQCGPNTNICIAPTPLPTAGVCTATGLCWAIPGYNYSDLNAVFVEPSGTVWAAGNAGTLIRWEGPSVRGWRHLLDADLTSVWVSPTGEVWVGASNGKVLRWSGSLWEDLSPGTNSFITALWGDAQGRVFIGGNDGFLRVFSNRSWVQPFTLANTASSIEGFASMGTALRIIANGSLYEWDGIAPAATRLATSCRYASQAVVSPTESWLSATCYSSTANSYYPSVSKTVGTTVTAATLPGSVMGARDAYLAARAANDVYLFSSTTRGWHFDGSSWATATTGLLAKTFEAGHASASRAAFAGREGVLIANAGAGWVSASPDAGWPGDITAPSRQAVVPVSDTRAVAGFTQFGSSTSTLYRLSLWENGAWLSTVNVTGELGAAYSPDGATVFAITAGNALHRFSGSTWSPLNGLPAGTYIAIGGTSSTDLWLAGVGKMVHYDGVTFTEVPTPFSGTTTAIDHLVAVTPTLAFASAGGNQLLKWNGSTWSLDTTIGAPITNAPIVKTSSGTVWVLTTAGLKRYSAGTWSTQALPAGQTAGTQLWGTTDANITIDTTAGRACTVLGAGFTCIPLPPGMVNERRIIKTGNRTWLVSTNGEIVTLRD